MNLKELNKYGIGMLLVKRRLVFSALVILVIFLISCPVSALILKEAGLDTGRQAQAAYTDDQIADAIYMAEGGRKAKVAYGILSVKVRGKHKARQVCLKTIKNNRERYANDGNKKFNTFLEFLASRYAPIGAKNDPRGLNKNWLRNVKYFLRQQTI